MPNQRAVDEANSALALIDTAVKKERRRLTSLLPAHIPAARAIETVMAAARKTPALRECTPESFAFALREAARWGLIPDGVMGQGYLIPRRNGETGLMEATFQAGYRGLEDLARRTGIVASIISGWHSKNDPHFVIRSGFNATIEHEPALTNPGDVIGFYAGAWLTNGAPPVTVYMTLAEVIAIRDAVPYWQRGPWASHFNMMGRKTAVRRLVTQLPLTPDMQAIVGLDEDGAFDRARNVTPVVVDEGGQDAPIVATAARARRALASRRGGQEDAPSAEPDEAPPVADDPPTESVSGVLRLPDVVGLNGVRTDTPAGPVIGFRLDPHDGQPWVQVVLSGEVLERYEASEVDTFEDGMTVTAVGRRVIIPREGKDPVIRIIATEDVQWSST